MASTTSTPKPCGAMALLDKYSTLNQGIDEARRRKAQAQSEIESVQLKMQRLLEEREEMQQQVKAAHADMVDLNARLKAASLRSNELEGMHSKTVMERNEAEREWKMAQRLDEEGRRAFFEKCREFRTVCKRIRLTASATGNDSAPTTAFLQTNGVVSCSSSDEEEDSDSEDEEEAEVHTVKVVETNGNNAGNSRGETDTSDNVTKEGDASMSSLENDEWSRDKDDHSRTDHGKGGTMQMSTAASMPFTRKAKNKKTKASSTKKKAIADPEMQQAQERERESFAVRKEAKRELDAVKSQREAALKHSANPASKLEQQRAQLERIRNDISEMEQQISSVQQETREARELSENFQKNATRRRRNASARSGTAAPSNFTGSDRYTPPPSSNENRVTPSSYMSQTGAGWSQGSSAQQQHGQTSSNSNTARVQNPYSRSKSSNQRSRSSNPYNMSNGRQSDLGYRGGSEQRRSSVEEQHPHRAGRIRVNRQFSTALEIMSGRESEREDNWPTKGIATSMAEERNDAPAAQETENIPPRTQDTVLEDDDDDDDDDLLSYVAFGTKKTS